MPIEKVKEVVEALGRKAMELTKGTDMHALVMVFSIDGEGIPEWVFAEGTFGQDQAGLLNCADMLHDMAIASPDQLDS